MQSSSEPIDSAWSRAGITSRVREHGFTILAALAGLIAFLVLRADMSLESFPGRALGIATLQDFDVAARTSLFPKVVLASGALIVGMLWALPALQRRLGRELFETLNTASVAFALLAFMVLWSQLAPATWALAGAFLALILLVWSMDRLGLASTRACDLGRDVVWIGTIAWCLAWILPEFSELESVRADPGAWTAWWVALGGAGIYVLRWLLSRRRDTARSASVSDRFVNGISVLAVVPFAMFAYREAFLLLNGRGYVSIEPTAVRIVVFGLLAVWIVARCVRGPRHLLADGRLDVERLLGRFVFPWLVLGIGACAYWSPTVALSDDFFESGNAALSVQQFFDFGRIPFLETFNAHGLSDCLFSFIDRALVGHHEASWQLYSHWYAVTAKVAIFFVLRIGLRGACPAMFAWCCLPYVDRLFHPVQVHGLVLVFVVLWAARRTSLWAWAGFFGSLVAAFAWRLDIGYAGTIASVATIVLLRITAADYRLPLRAITGGALTAGAATLALLGGLAALHGVNLLHWFRDMAHVVSSNQGFGYTSIARELNPIVMWHLYGLPLAMTLSCAWIVVRWRPRLELGSAAMRSFVVIMFLATFTLANFPRGLVRHSFLEGENAMTSAFTISCLAFVPTLLVDQMRARFCLIVFVVVSSILSFTFDLQLTQGRRSPITTTRYERTSTVMSSLPKLEASAVPVVRAPIDEAWKLRHIAGIQAFFDKQLEREQTFFDLSSSPLLYFHLRRPSPQWLNHLLLVYDDYLQDRALEEWKQWDTPFLLMPADRELARAQSVVPWDNIDGVEMRLRLYKLFEHAYAEYQPYGFVGRWPVWVRKDWLQLAPPRSPKHDTVFMWTPAGIDERILQDDQRATAVEIGLGGVDRVPLVTADRNSSLYLRLETRSDAGGTIDLAWAVSGPDETTDVSRELHCPAGSNERYYVLPATRGSRDLESLRLTAHEGVVLERVELVRCTSRETTALPPVAFTSVVSHWDQLARLWGTYDPPFGERHTTIATLYDSAESLEPSYSMGLDRETDSEWLRGIARGRSAVRLANTADAEGVRLGDTIHFDSGERRTVLAIEGRDIALSGEPLPAKLAAESRILLHPERMSKLPITPTTKRRFEVDSVPHGEVGTYLWIRMRSKETDVQQVRIDYGVKNESRGRFVFDARVDGEFHDYVVRLSTHFNWAAQVNRWIDVVPSVGVMELDRVLLVEERP